MLQTQSNLNIAQPRNSVKKSGISIISCHLLKPIKRTATMTNENMNTNTMQNIKGIVNKTKNEIRRQKNNRQNYKPLRSLSAERIRWKKEKNMKKNQLKEDQQRGDMQGNINLLELQYDQLRLKRSLLTQRQSEKSGGKPRISDAQIKSQPKLTSDISNSLITKCVPKSKINLNLFTSQTQPHHNIHPSPSNPINEKQQKQVKKQRHIQRERISSTSSASASASNMDMNMNMKILDSHCHLSQSVCSSSLSNLQVIPIGLNVSIAMNNKTQFSTCLLSKSYFRRKGIKVVSRNRDDGVSLDNSVVSLEVVRQVSKGKLGYKTEQSSVVKLKKSYQNIAAYNMK